MKLPNKYISIPLMPALLLIFTSGCASSKMVRCKAETQSVNSSRISIGNINTYKIDGEILVAGNVYPCDRIGVHQFSPGHIDITVFDSNTNSLSSGKTTYFPRPIKHKPRGGKERSTFSTSIPVDPEKSSLIRVSHHDVSISKCSLSRY